ncbi:hypothetical protein [Chryseobacterium sp. SIMBA_029]|uniref:hypothetical protein n=1 Tax=Chryseobacterium sp. SIMBA_029 TaxID=3085772 RepID=UPI00397AC024
MEIKKVILTTEEKTVVRKIFTINLVGLVLLLTPFLSILFFLCSVRAVEYKETVFLLMTSFLVLTTLALPFLYAREKLVIMQKAFKIIKDNQKLVVVGKLINVRSESRILVYQVDAESYALKAFLGVGLYIQKYDTNALEFYPDQEVVINCLPEIQLLFTIDYPKLEHNKEIHLPLEASDITYLRKNTFKLLKPTLGIVLFDLIILAVFYFIAGSFSVFMLVIIFNALPFTPNLYLISKSLVSREKVVVSGIVTEIFKIDTGYKTNDLISRRYCVSLGGRLFRCARLEMIVLGEQYSVAYTLNKDGSMGRMLGRQNV